MKNINRRLLPLYVTAFMQGFVLWYAVEKLFLTTIGFNNATIGIMAGVTGLVVFLAEVPSGILADRWSRKGVLALGSITLAAASLIGGLSHTVVDYYFAAALWSVFYAMYSGTYDSIVYDTLLEEQKTGAGYERLLGNIRLMDSSALLVGSLSGGLVAAKFGLRETYFVTLPVSVLSIVPILLFKEPKLHKQSVEGNLLSHIRTTFRHVFRNKELYFVVAVMLLCTVVSRLTFEFNQLWYIALIVPTIWYGPVNAFVQQAIGASGFLGHKLLYSRNTIAVIAGSMLVASLLLVTKLIVPIIVTQFLIITLCYTAILLLSKRLHDVLISQVRAGASSAVSTLGHLFFLPVALVFGFWANEASIFIASWLVVAFAGILFLLSLRLPE